ncbi:hypothetical protein [Paradesulfitobacterium aromaticivorans]
MVCSEFHVLRKGKKLLLVLALVFTLLLIWSNAKYVRNDTLLAGAQHNSRLPWLLESGLVDAPQAEVRLILWFNGDQIPRVLRQELAQREWKWQTSVKETAGGTQAVTVLGRRLVTRDEETEINKWYAGFAAKVERNGGYLYLDERVAGTVDIAAYLTQVEAQPRQWMAADQTHSIAAYRPDGSKTVQAGPDRINIQVLTRSGTGTGKSVLALPTLLEEF